MSEDINAINKKANLTIEIPESDVYSKQQESSDLAVQKELTQIQSNSQKRRKLSVEQKEEKSSEELLDECEDELDVLKNVIKHMEQNTVQNSQQEQDLSMAQYVSIIQRTIQSLRILTKKSMNMDEDQRERLDKFCLDFDKSFREYQKQWKQNY